MDYAKIVILSHSIFIYQACLCTCKIVLDKIQQFTAVHTAIFETICDCLDQICKADNYLLQYCSEGDWLEWICTFPQQ